MIWQMSKNKTNSFPHTIQKIIILTKIPTFIVKIFFIDIATIYCILIYPIVNNKNSNEHKFYICGLRQQHYV